MNRVVRMLGVAFPLCLTAGACAGGEDANGRTDADAAGPGPSGGPSSRESPAPATIREAGDRATFYLRGADQRSDGRTVVVDEAVLTGTSGWVVVHSIVGGALGPVIGTSELLPAGTSTKVIVTLTKPVVKPQATVYAMLHLESTGNATYDFPNGDGAARGTDADVVTFPLELDID